MQGMIDMAKTPVEVKKEMKDYAMPSAAPDGPSVPQYPYGLCISMDEDSLEKIGEGDELPEVGEVVHLVALAKVTSASSREEITSDGAKKVCRRVELQITHLAVQEDGEDEERGEKMRSALYADDGDR
jgi:hypothetical protein